MDWFIRKSNQHPEMYKYAVKGDILHCTNIQFAQNYFSPYAFDFLMAELRVILSRCLFNKIQTDLIKEGYPADLFYRDEAFLMGMVDSYHKNSKAK